ncbi:unnamed protein product [Euphydryas editha]|uniref:Uncharacterized protein n=1 Tax=Euphydryas editha TaxID=104508 RepID=A0AAU9V3M4_EUPED|nr:unnamed protein product [Euphydryas editha]
MPVSRLNNKHIVIRSVYPPSSPFSLVLTETQETPHSTAAAGGEAFAKIDPMNPIATWKSSTDLHHYWLKEFWSAMQPWFDNVRRQ